MKKLIVLLGVIGISAVMLMSGCQKEEDEPGNPSVSFIAEAGFVSADATLNINEEFKMKVGLFKNTESNSDLNTLTIGRTFTPATRADWDTTLTLQSGDNQQFELFFTSATIAGDELIEITVTDKNGKSDMKSITITTVEPGVMSYDGIELGSWNDPTGSFFATSDGSVMNKTEATAMQEKVDIIFFLGASNGSTFGGPTDATVQDVFDIADWTTQNNTLFINPAPVSAAEFDAIGTTYSFPEFNEGDAATKATQLNNNEVIFFKTDGGKLGFLKINSINGRGDKVDFDIKVQE
jgi:hypothetical protein